MTRALAVLAPRPAAGPALPFLELLLGPADAALSRLLLLRVLDPADELVTGQRSDVVPRVERDAVGRQRVTQIRWELVHHATWHSRAAHGCTVVAEKRLARVTPIRVTRVSSRGERCDGQAGASVNG